jgi:hypothetical protein
MKDLMASHAAPTAIGCSQVCIRRPRMERWEFIARLGGTGTSPFVGARATISWITILIVLFLLAVGWKEANLDGQKFRPALQAFKPAPNNDSLPWARNVLCTFLLGPFAPYLSYLFIFHSERLPADGSIVVVLCIFGPLSLVFLLCIWTGLIIDLIRLRKKKSGKSLPK